MSKEKTVEVRAVEPNVPNTSGSTPNYGLPQWQGDDMTDWFELNPAFEKIDESMKANADAAQVAQTTADSNTQSVGNLTQSLNNTIERTTALERENTTLQQQVTLNTTHLNEHDTAIQAAETAIEALQNQGGDTSGDVAALQGDVTALQGQMTTVQGVANTNADHIGNLAGLETTAKANLVSAINELKESQAGGETFDFYIGDLPANLGSTPLSKLKDGINIALNDTGMPGGTLSAVISWYGQIGTTRSQVPMSLGNCHVLGVMGMPVGSGRSQGVVLSGVGYVTVEGSSLYINAGYIFGIGSRSNIQNSQTIPLSLPKGKIIVACPAGETPTLTVNSNELTWYKL